MSGIVAGSDHATHVPHVVKQLIQASALGLRLCMK